MNNNNLNYFNPKSKPIEGKDRPFPLEPKKHSYTGDLYLNIDEFQVYLYDGEKYNKTKILPEDFINSLTFYKIDDAENKFCCYFNHLHYPGYIDLYMIHYMKLENFKKYVARDQKSHMVIYEFTDETELAMFQIFFGSQIKYNNT